MDCAHVLACVLLLLCWSADKADGKAETCYVKPGGQVTNFKGENYNVLIPCKYRLVHMTCGDYKVKVTPGNGLDRGGQLYPDTVWVGITRKVNGRQTMWKGRTAGSRLEKADTLDELWVDKVVINMTLDVEAYQSQYRSAVLEMRGAFRISYAVDGPQKGVYVACFSHTFHSMPYPKSICGNGRTRRIIESRRQQILGTDTLVNNTEANMIIFDVMNNHKVTQREICTDAAATFQACREENKVTVARLCGSIFSHRDLSTCLLTAHNMVGDFDRCMGAVCKGRSCACRKLYDKVKTKCLNQNLVINFDRLRCGRN